jgi:predicted PurR-regulated permease PerM
VEPVSADEAPVAPVAVNPRLGVPRWIQLVSLPLVLLAAWALGSAMQHALLIFLVASLVAILLNPIVHGLTTLGVRRGLAVLIVYLCGFLMLLTVIVVAGSVVVDQVASAARVVDDEFTSKPGTTRTPADDKIDELQGWLDRNGLRRLHVRPVGQQVVQRIQARGISSYAQRAIDVGKTLATAIATGLFNMILILVVSIYMLLDAPRLSRSVDRVLPPGPDGRGLGGEVQRALVGYVRGQLIVSVIIGASAGIAMEVFGLTGIWPAARSYAIFFGLFAMVTEAIPYVGPILGAVPPVALALIDDPVTALWVALAFLVIHQLEGHVVVPRVMGNALRAHPLAVIFGLLAGDELYGFAGALLALPTLAVGRTVLAFVRERLLLEQWPANDRVGAGLDLAQPVAPTPPVVLGPAEPPPPAVVPPA